MIPPARPGVAPPASRVIPPLEATWERGRSTGFVRWAALHLPAQSSGTCGYKPPPCGADTGGRHPLARPPMSRAAPAEAVRGRNDRSSRRGGSGSGRARRRHHAPRADHRCEWVAPDAGSYEGQLVAGGVSPSGPRVVGSCHPAALSAAQVGSMPVVRFDFLVLLDSDRDCLTYYLNEMQTNLSARLLVDQEANPIRFAEAWAEAAFLCLQRPA
jgi:hypothetical protein